MSKKRKAAEVIYLTHWPCRKGDRPGDLFDASDEDDFPAESLLVKRLKKGWLVVRSEQNGRLDAVQQRLQAKGYFK